MTARSWSCGQCSWQILFAIITNILSQKYPMLCHCLAILVMSHWVWQCWFTCLSAPRWSRIFHILLNVLPLYQCTNVSPSPTDTIQYTLLFLGLPKNNPFLLLMQGWPTMVLESHCPACFLYFPAPPTALPGLDLLAIRNCKCTDGKTSKTVVL